MSVHYKFKSALDYDTVTFDGLHISVGDLKAAISQQKRIGKTSDFDLQITNAQTKEVYVDDTTLIPKNTSLLVARIPLSQQLKKHWEGSGSGQGSLHKDVGLKGLADLSRMEGSEQDKINAMISQSTVDYDPINYQKIRGQNQRGIVPPNYVCYKCQKRGHWIKDCPVTNSGESIDIKRSTGIPRSFMVPVDGPKAPGAMMTPSGTYAVPAVDHEAYLASENAGGADTPTNAPAAPEPTVPDELICSLCRDLLTDAVMIPCCGNSFCDECIRGALLESEDHECPDCREKEIAPTTLIPNRFLRNSVSSFRNQTGYSRRQPHRPSAAVAVPAPAPVADPVVPPAVVQPPNGPVQAPPAPHNDVEGAGAGRGDESDGSGDDNVTVTVPPAHAHRAPPARRDRRDHHRDHRRDRDRDRRHTNMHRTPHYGPPPGIKPPKMNVPANPPINMPRMDEQRASTPTIDERRDPMSHGMYNRGPPPFIPGVPPPNQRFNNNPQFGRHGPMRLQGGPPFPDRYLPPEPFQPPPPGIKDSPSNGVGDDPLEAFNRMIREKEMRAKRREEERRRAHTGSRSASRSPSRQRSLRSPRSPPRSPRSPRMPRSPRSPRARPRSRGASRIRYSRSRSMSRGRIRRSPWSPRRRRTRERTLSLTRSPSPRRRHRSPLRYRSPLRSPLRTPLRSPLRTPLRSPPRSPPRSPLRSPPRSPRALPVPSPHRSPIRPLMRSPLPRPISPHATRYAGVYDELLSPPRRSVEPPFGPRYGPRNGAPPNVYPPLGSKALPLPMSLPNEPPPGYRGRYDGPPFEDVPPGVEPPVPGFEPSPFDKQPFAPPNTIERDRLPPPNYRDNYRQPPYTETPGGYRDMPIPPLQNEIPVHVGDHPRFRDNYRPGHSFREHGPASYRDGQPFRDQGLQTSFRDPREPNFRGGPPPFRDSYRNMPYREGGFRDNSSHNYRDNGAPFRAPSTDPRDPQSGPPYNEPNYREVYRDENGPGRDNPRSGYRSNMRNKGSSRRNPNVDHERFRERDGRERERLNENIPERPDKQREPEKRSGHEKTREIRDDRNREYDRNRDYDKERERVLHDKTTPDKKVRVSPKRPRDVREKKRSESRGRSRDRERERRDKKEDKVREKSSDRSREHKEKDKKLKDRKKKKREKEKEKDSDKKKKRDKKEKKEKEPTKKDLDSEKKEVSKEKGIEDIPKDIVKEEPSEEVNERVIIKTEEQPDMAKTESDASKTEVASKVDNDLYGDEAAEAVDKEIIQNYVKVEPKEEANQSKSTDTSKEEPFDGIELQAPIDDLEADMEGVNTNKEMLAPLPELSKWEVEDENAEKTKEPGEITSPEDDEEGKVTTEVIKRAENAIFAKAINSLRPIEIKKISSDRVKLYNDEPQPKNTMTSIQITVPVTDVEQRSVELNDRKRRHSKTPPPRLSVKDRLGGKVEDIKKPREHRVVQSTVERVKSRSKTPKREQAPYRRVTVEKERSRKNETGRIDVQKSDRRVVAEEYKLTENYRGVVPNERKRESDKSSKEDKKSQNDEKTDLRSRGHDKTTDQNKNAERERKKSTLDEANFEPDYDETVESEPEHKEEVNKKRERSGSPHGPIDSKKPKIDNETIKLDLTNVKKKPETDTESSSGSEYSSSSSSSDARKKKKKKKRAKKKKKRAASESDSDYDSSSDDHKKKKKKRKHKKKSSKKKKKSKNK